MHPATHPILPPELLERHHCHEPMDTRFRASARLLQAIWREKQGHPCGFIRDATGKPRRLGSRLTPKIARAGVNLIDISLLPLVKRELAYREIGALIETERFWSNLIASHPLTFSLFGPLKQKLALATAVFGRLLPDLVSSVTDILFEHSPGRRNPAFTGDNTAFDVLICCITPAARKAFLAIEVKYTEAPSGVRVPVRERYIALSRAAAVFQNPDSPVLRSGALGQFWRQHLLAHAMIEQGLYDEGWIVVLAPAANRECQIAVRRYARELTDNRSTKVGFSAVTLETMVAVLADVGEEVQATRLTQRYLDFSPVEDALAASFIA